MKADETDSSGVALLKEVGKAVLWLAGGLTVTVVGGVALEHVIRKMDRGLFHLPGTDLYWRPGGEPFQHDATGPGVETRPPPPGVPSSPPLAIWLATAGLPRG